MSFKAIGVPAVTLALVGILALGAGSATASHVDFEQRRAEREAERAARDAEREARRAAREEERGNPAPSCSCSASLKLAKPTLQFKNGVLSLIPRVDVTIRSRGDADAPHWESVLNYEGSAAYESEDVTVPGGTSFAGSQDIAGGSCGTNYTFRGRALPEVSLTGVLQSLVGVDQELTGAVEMQANLTGCGDEETVHRQFEFAVEEFGNLKVKSWRSVR